MENSVQNGQKTEKTPVLVEILTPECLPDVLVLQNAVRAALSDDQKMFVLPQPDSYFEKFLMRQGGLMVGLRENGTLVAQIVLMGALSLDEVIESNALTRSEVTLHHATSTDHIIIAKSMAVHPERQGNGLSQKLLQAMLTQTAVRSADHIFAQISAENIRSWELFLRNGFGIVAAALDPSDGKPRFVLQRPTRGFVLHPMASVDDVDALADFASIMRLTQREALIGFSENLTPGGLAFFARAENAVSWYDKAVEGE